ncbi:MAG TPA: di-heme oxidoredictase family protein [Pirellulales bacterium]|nr:di-heme oxidoredictase family protein [Pirellulales bacterium]
MRANIFASRWSWVAAAMVLGVVVLTAQAKDQAADKDSAAKVAAVAAPASASKTESAVDGRELFTREWLPNDSRAHGGDGLGPVYNDSSCVACHNQGGVGGAGPANKNVDIVTAFPLEVAGVQQGVRSNTLPEALFSSLFGSLAPPAPAKPQAAGAARAASAEQEKTAKQRQKEELIKLHPGFASARSVVLHHFGTDPKYQAWRTQMVSGQFAGQQQAVLNQVTLTTVETSAAPDLSDVALPTDAVAPAPVVTQQAAPDASAAAKPEGTLAVPGAADLTQPAPVLAVEAAPGVAIRGSLTLNAGVSIASNPEIAQLQNEVRTNHANLLSTTTQIGSIQISRSQRNATALYGVGAIDAIPEKTILDLAKHEKEKYPDMAGRPSKQKDGKIGRFGWKAQKPTLYEFAMTACAVELGLNVPGHEQAALPLKPDYKAPGLDMNQAECDALVKYLKELPAPTQRKPASAQEAGTIDAGHKQFVAVGCANCHVQKVGAADGIYSDLLLHEMGPELGDIGDYGVFVRNAPEEDQQEQPAPQFVNPNSPEPQAKLSTDQLGKVVGAMRQEWRTPPLWGVRDSGPYLHDGRADTLEQAIAFHGGQASSAAVKFFQLKPEERQKVIAFLKSLTAPEQKIAMK